jgi:hypothetical protein
MLTNIRLFSNIMYDSIAAVVSKLDTYTQNDSIRKTSEEAHDRGLIKTCGKLSEYSSL